MSCQHPQCTLESEENEKCIFHCEKDSWFTINDKGEKDWQRDKVDKFWDQLNDQLRIIYEESTDRKNLDISLFGSLTSYGNGNSQNYRTINGFNIPPLFDISNLDDSLPYYYFDSCTFLDDFVINLKFKDKYLNTSFDFHSSTFKGKLEIKGDSSGVNAGIKISSTKHYNDILFEADYFKYVEISNINYIIKGKDETILPKINIVFSPTLVLRHLTFDNIILRRLDRSNINNIKLWYIKVENLIANQIFGEYVKLNDFSIKESIVNKCHLNSFNIKELTLKNVIFRDLSIIDIINMKIKDFYVDNISQESEYINFDNIEVSNSFICNQMNFKNTSFNNFDLSECNKKFINTTFTDSHLNSIKWGNINQIISNRETFRQLKSLNDQKSNFVDANNFFVKEMKEYKSEIDINYKKDIEKKKYFSSWLEEKIVFFMNEKISNFGRSWFQSIVWLFIISLFFFNIVEEYVKLH